MRASVVVAAGAGLVVLAAIGILAARDEPPLPAVAHVPSIAQPKARLFLPNGEVRSVLNVGRRMAFGDFVWNDAGVPDGSITVRVDRARQLISVLRAGHEIGTAVILFGADEKPTPPGRFPVLAKMREHRSSLYDADMPFTLRLTGDGISIHGVDVREGAATHGCIGVPNAFAERLFDRIAVGDPVEIS